MLDGEHKLIKDAVGGKSSAFGSLYDRYHPKIYRFVLIKVGRREEAEDLTHQVFLHAWQHIGSYTDLGYPFSSWLYRIARNQIIDHYRTKKDESAIDEVDPDHLLDPDRHAADTDLKFSFERVITAIRTLKPEYQDVLIMRFVEELSVKETAAA